MVKGNNIQVGRKLYVEDEPIDILKNKKEGMFILDSENPKKLMKEYGEMPTPPYIKKQIEEPQEYQTIYAEDKGSIAAPTAGLHFTEEILNKIKKKGIEMYDVILHVGPVLFYLFMMRTSINTRWEKNITRSQKIRRKGSQKPMKKVEGLYWLELQQLELSKPLQMMK